MKVTVEDAVYCLTHQRDERLNALGRWIADLIVDYARENQSDLWAVSMLQEANHRLQDVEEEER